MIDISLVNNGLPSPHKFIELLKYALSEYEYLGYNFTFTNSVLYSHELLTLGMVRKITPEDKYKYSLDFKTYIDMKISEILDGLALGVIHQCQEHNRKEATIERCYLYTYTQEGNIMLGGFVRIYFDN